MADQAGSPAQPLGRTADTGLSFRRRSPEGSGGGAVRRRLIELFGPVFTMFAAAVFAGAATFGQTDMDPSSTSGEQHNFLQTGCYAIILVVVAPLLVHRRAALGPIIAQSKLLWLFVALAYASILWAVDPANALRRLILFSTPILTALYMVDRFDYTTAIKIKGWIYLLMIVASAALAVLWPAVGVMHADPNLPIDLVEGNHLEGDWSGIVDHKNSLGFITLASTQIYAWRWTVEKNHRWFLSLALLLGVFVTYKTHSATAGLLVAMTLTTCVIALLALAAPRAGALIVFFVAVFAIGAAFLAILLPDEMAALVGKDATLTGRVPIWRVLIEHSIPLRPVLGYGFNSFFIDRNPEYLRLVEIVDWKAPHAHNGYINLAAELGIPGAIIGTLILLRIITGSLGIMRRENVDWPLYLLVFGLTFFVLNLVEASLLRQGDQWTFALAFAYLALAKHAVETRTAPPAESRRPRPGFFPAHWDPKLRIPRGQVVAAASIVSPKY